MYVISLCAFKITVFRRSTSQLICSKKVLFRPPEREFWTALCFTTDASFYFFIYFFYHRISELPRPIAVKVCDRHLDAFYNPSPKIQKICGPYPKKNLGPKACKVWGDFTQLPTLVADISGTSQHIQNQKDMRYVTENDSFSIRRNKYGELWSTVYKVGHVSLDPPKSTFLGDCFGSYGVLAPQIFYMC